MLKTFSWLPGFPLVGVQELQRLELVTTTTQDYFRLKVGNQKKVPIQTDISWNYSDMFHMSLTSVSKEWQMRPSFWHISKDCHCSVGAFWNGTDCFNCPDGVLCAGGTSEPLQVAGKVKEWEKIQTRFWPSRVDSMLQFENQKIADFWVECSVVYRVGSLISHFWTLKYWKMNMQEDDSLECSAMLAIADWWCHMCQTEPTSSRCCHHLFVSETEISLFPAWLNVPGLFAERSSTSSAFSVFRCKAEVPSCRSREICICIHFPSAYIDGIGWFCRILYFSILGIILILLILIECFWKKKIHVIHVLFISFNYITQPFHNRNETKRGPLSTGRTGQLCCWPRGPWMWQLRIWFVCHGRWHLHPMHSTMALTVKILRKSGSICQILSNSLKILVLFDAILILVNVLSNDSCFYFFLVGCFWNLSTKSVEWFPVPVSFSFWYNAVIIFSWGLWQWLILMKMIGPDGNRLRFFVRRRGRDTYLLRPGSGLCAFTTMTLMIKKLWTFKGKKTKENQRNWNRTYTYYTYTHFPPKIYLSHLFIVFTAENAFCKNQKNDQSGSGIWEKTSEERRCFHEILQVQWSKKKDIWNLKHTTFWQKTFTQTKAMNVSYSMLPQEF